MAPLIKVRKIVGVCCCNNRLSLNDRIRSCAIKLKIRIFNFFIYLFILQAILEGEFELRTSNRRITTLNRFNFTLFIR
ncbi:unnamed protein product [Prunus brigantina]